MNIQQKQGVKDLYLKKKWVEILKLILIYGDEVWQVIKEIRREIKAKKKLPVVVIWQPLGEFIPHPLFGLFRQFANKGVKVIINPPKREIELGKYFSIKSKILIQIPELDIDIAKEYIPMKPIYEPGWPNLEILKYGDYGRVEVYIREWVEPLGDLAWENISKVLMDKSII